MFERLQIHKCSECGLIIEVVRGGDAYLTCCGKPMELLEEKTADFTTEKHVPVVEKTAEGVKVTVGSTIHPMLDEHYIEWIEISYDSVVQRKTFKPGDEPVAFFAGVTADEITAREHCNLHGLWKD